MLKDQASKLAAQKDVISKTHTAKILDLHVREIIQIVEITQFLFLYLFICEKTKS